MIDLNKYYLFKKDRDPILKAFIANASKDGAFDCDAIKRHARAKYDAIILTSQIEGWWGVKFIHPRKLTMFLLKV